MDPAEASAGGYEAVSGEGGKGLGPPGDDTSRLRTTLPPSSECRARLAFSPCRTSSRQCLDHISKLYEHFAFVALYARATDS